MAVGISKEKKKRKNGELMLLFLVPCFMRLALAFGFSYLLKQARGKTVLAKGSTGYGKEKGPAWFYTVWLNIKYKG